MHRQNAAVAGATPARRTRTPVKAIATAPVRARTAGREPTLEGGCPRSAQDHEYDDRGQDEPVQDEDAVRVPAHVAEQPVDREQAAPERSERSDEERPLP